MTDHAHAAAHPAGHAPHRNYVRIWAILTALLVVSVTGPLIGIRVVTLIAAFGVALVKAYLVAKNFMHLDIEKPIVHWALGIALVFMVLLYAGVAPDVQKTTGDHWTKTPGFHYVSRQAEGAPEHGSEGKAGDKAGSGTTHGSDTSGK
jgi:caa(3)-type oxidase subunit IV